MKYSAIKIFWFFINPLRKIYWFIFRPQTLGVKCLIENNEKFLLVKLNYAHKKWTIPGGGVNKHESFLEAAIREAKEETGIEVRNPVLIGIYKNINEYKNDTVEVYLGQSNKLEIKIDHIEIKEARWFHRNELPEDRGPVVDKILKFYDEYKSAKN